MDYITEKGLRKKNISKISGRRGPIGTLHDGNSSKLRGKTTRGILDSCTLRHEEYISIRGVGNRTGTGMQDVICVMGMVLSSGTMDHIHACGLRVFLPSPFIYICA